MSGNMLGIPSEARTAWIRLGDAIERTGPTPCAGPDRDDWTGSGTQQARAAAACMDCAVLSACGAYADAAGEARGVWGGYTARERQIRRGGAR